MQKHFRIIFNLIIIILLIGIPTSVFAVDKSASIDDQISFTEQIYSTPYVDNFSPGDSVDHFMTIKNEADVQVGLYFVNAKETINNWNLNKITFSIYVDNAVNNLLYKRGNHLALTNQLIYVLNPGDEITITTNILMDKSADNYYQEKTFNIEWTLGIVEHEEPIDPPKPIDPPEKREPVDPVDPKDPIIIGPIQKEETPKKPQTIVGQVGGYIGETLEGLTGSVNNIVIAILTLVGFLALVELGRGIHWIIILLNIKNTKIYVRVIEESNEAFKLLAQDDIKRKYKEEKFRLIEENAEKREEVKYKLVKKIRTKNENEIKLDLNQLAEEYKTDDLKIIFNKRISKKIDKAKVTIDLHEQSLHYDAKYNKNPIELDVKI